MEEFVAWLQPIVERFGGIGMAIMAFIDCSFVSMPNISDVLIIWQTIEHPDRWWYYAAMTTAWVGGRLHGDLRGRPAEWGSVPAEAIQAGVCRSRPVIVRAIRNVGDRRDRHDAAPCAIQGVRAPRWRRRGGPGMFALAVVIGRGLRYGIEGWLARVYGAAATDLIKDNATAVSLWLLAIAIAAGLVFVWWKRRVGRRTAA